MAKNRARGEGSIYRRGDGLWVGALASVGPDGKMKRRYIYAATQKDVVARLQALRAEVLGLSPHEIAGRPQTVGEFLDHWLEAGPKQSIRATTLRSYKSHVLQHIGPGLGRIRLDRLTPQQVQKWLGGLARADGMTDERTRDKSSSSLSDLTPATKRRIHATLRRALNQAVRWGIIKSNPAAGLELPEQPQQTVEPPSREEVLALLRHVDGDRLEAFYYVLIGLGLRRGEALAMQWRFLDLDAGTISVRYSLSSRGSEYDLLPTKTHGSRAVLFMPDILVRKLRQRQVIQAQERELAGADWCSKISVGGKQTDNDLVFTRLDGKPLDTSAATHRFQKLLAQAGLPKRRMHDWRHATATFLLEEGADIRSIAGQLRHRSIALAADVYTHFAPRVAKRNADMLSRVIDPAATDEDAEAPAPAAAP